jgi:hypothetical protein
LLYYLQGEGRARASLHFGTVTYDQFCRAGGVEYDLQTWKTLLGKLAGLEMVELTQGMLTIK